MSRKPHIDTVKLVHETYKKVKSQRKTSDLLGIPRSTLAEYLKYNVKEYEKIFSEDTNRFREDWTAQDCIDELRRIASENPEKIITRNYFRNKSVISESTWNRYFGTFEEFKREAGIKLRRDPHSLEKHIAKHASQDKKRKMNVERAKYSENYIVPSSGRYKTVIVCSDLHDIECDPFYLEVLIDTAKRIQPDLLVFNGDIFDLPEFSKYTVDPRTWDAAGRIKFVHEKIFKPLREACPDTQFDFIEGNHEYRLLRHLTEATPALKAVLAELHGFTISKLLGLDEFEINYIAKADMTAYNKSDIEKEIKKNYKVYYDSFLVHHHPEGKKLGFPGINGHHHKLVIDTHYNEIFQSYQWIQSGCGHMRDAEYTMGEKWSLGFVLAHVDTESCKTIFEPININQEFAVVGGKYYFR